MQGCRVYYFFISFIFRVFFFFCVTSYISGECVKKNKNQITARAKKKKIQTNKHKNKSHKCYFIIFLTFYMFITHLLIISLLSFLDFQ